MKRILHILPALLLAVCLLAGSVFAVLDQSGNLASDQCFSLVCSSAKFSITCHYSFPPFVEQPVMLLWSY